MFHIKKKRKENYRNERQNRHLLSLAQIQSFTRKEIFNFLTQLKKSNNYNNEMIVIKQNEKMGRENIRDKHLTCNNRKLVDDSINQ